MKRPIVITALCIVLVVAGAADVVALGGFVRELIKHPVMPPWLFLFYVAFAPAMKLGCAVGMWKMRRWSVYVYACWLALSTILLLAWLGVFSPVALIIQILVVAVSFFFICWPCTRHVEQSACT
jgi:hypothetical protein